MAIIDGENKRGRQLRFAWKLVSGSGNGDAAGGGRSLEEEWVITERWRSVEQPLAPNATILDIWNAWGDAQSEVCHS